MTIFLVNDQNTELIEMKSISDEKRIKVLERIFEKLGLFDLEKE